MNFQDLEKANRLKNEIESLQKALKFLPDKENIVCIFDTPIANYLPKRTSKAFDRLVKRALHKELERLKNEFDKL